MEFQNLINQGLVQHKKNKFTEARSYYESALIIQPKNIDALSLLGAVFAQTNNVDLAIKVFKEILEIEPKNPQALYNLALMYQEKKKFIEALETYEIVEKIDPKDHTVLNNKGNIPKFVSGIAVKAVIVCIAQ
jgi:tetratricopeptide (TPR) repeat protein